MSKEKIIKVKADAKHEGVSLTGTAAALVADDEPLGRFSLHF